MNVNNICKFIPEPIAYEREVINFVCEKKPEVMKKEIPLDHHRLCLVSRGEISFFCNGKMMRRAAGDIVFLFEGERVYAEPEERAEFLYITFSGARYEELFRRFSIGHDSRSFSGFDGLIPLWSESLSRAIDENIDLVAESMLIYTFSRLSGSSGNITDVINKIVEMSEKSFTDPELSLGTISERLNYNSKYVSHLFKKRMGVPYTEYLRMLRLKYAISLLDHGIDSIKNVALLSGFSDPLYFSTVFKASVGKSPKEYIMSKRRADDD